MEAYVSTSTREIPLCTAPEILRMSGRQIHGLRGPEHYRLDRFWCLNLFQGEGQLRIGNECFPFKSGYAGITWPGPELIYTFKEVTIKTWVHFIPNKKAQTIKVPVMQDLGADFDRIRTDLEAVSSLFRTQSERAIARVWDVLWRVAPSKIANAHQKNRHPIITKAMDEIDIRLTENFSVSELAAELEISQTHLNRLFKDAIGKTVGSYIRSKRLEWAHHLLAHTTMPIKEIAHMIGTPDAQHFNKIVRRHFGRSPSQLRENP